ncbi:hypothetical protein BH10ACT2_BH10ACT2_25980 [soil metagenome]
MRLKRSKARGQITTLIGRRCKHGNVRSRPVLIGRGLGFTMLVLALEYLEGLRPFSNYVVDIYWKELRHL